MSDIELEKLRDLHGEVVRLTEGERVCALLPKLRFPSGGAEQEMDVLLYPHEHQGYVTRLFFEKPLSIGSNWNPHYVCGDTWYAPSRPGVRADQPWTAILAAPLRAVEQ